METTRRGFLAGLFGTMVIAALPKATAAFEDVRVAPAQVPVLTPPDGMSYQWVRAAVYGDETFSRVEECIGNGWQLVPPAVHPDMVAVDIEEAVKSHGLVLMMKPTVTVELERRQKYEADMALIGESRTYPVGQGSRFDPPVPGARPMTEQEIARLGLDIDGEAG